MKVILNYCIGFSHCVEKHLIVINNDSNSSIHLSSRVCMWAFKLHWSQ